jgi:lysozyme family protein
MSSYPLALDFVLKNEGGFVDDPDDPGGATNMGITIETLTRWRRRVDPACRCTVDDIRALTILETSDIYFGLWWVPMLLGNVWSTVIAKSVLDSAILFGIPEALTCVQRGVNEAATGILLTPPVKVDGIAGADTISHLNAVNVGLFLKCFVSSLTTVVSEIEKNHPQDKKYDKGWKDRIQKYLIDVRSPQCTP